MEIRIDGTDKIVNLGIIDPESGTNWITDFIGNNGGFGSITDGLIDQDPEHDWLHLADADTVKWWQDMIVAYEGMLALIDEYSGKYGANEIQDYLQFTHAFDCDLEDQPNSVKLNLSKYEN